MALKPDQLNAGFARGIAGEKKKTVDRFQLADQMTATKALTTHGRIGMQPASPPDIPPTTPRQTEGKLRVSLDRVDDNPYGPRVFYDGATVAQRAQSLKAEGQKVPVAATI